MGPPGGTPYFDCFLFLFFFFFVFFFFVVVVFGGFLYFSTHRYVKNSRTTAVKIANDSRIILRYVRNNNLMSESNYFLALESIERYS